MSAQIYRQKLNQITGFSDRARQRRKTVKVLLIAAVIAALLAVAALGYAQVKYNIFHFADHSSVFFSHGNKKEVNDVMVGYVPKGFSLTNETRQKDSIAQEYERNKLCFNIVKGSVHDSIDVNTEYVDGRIVSINDIDYLIYGEAKHGRGILWSINDYTYSITGNLAEEEMIKIAVSVR